VKRKTLRISLVLSAALIVAVLAVGTAAFAASSTTFGMASNDCVHPLKAHGKVTINSLGPVEVMDVTLNNMPKRTAFDLFVIQQPTAPFGISWYLGDMRTDRNGHAEQRFIGRFSRETFAVAPGATSAPVVDSDPPFPDASSNPAFNPVHTLHLGLWFNKPAGAVAAGCPNTETPFNGDHTAGVQALHTNTNPTTGRGPLDAIH
jgi:hypothetical protein